MGLMRSLSTAEILEQVRLAAEVTRAEQRQLRNVVFMGMGEPLDNETAVYGALDLLLDKDWFSIPARRIILSTVGVPEAMRRFVDRYPEVQFALSLHGARPDVRAKLIPWSRRHSWDELQDALRYVAQRHPVRRKQSPILIEYLMLQGVNDSDDDADALVTYLHRIPAHVNLIPYNPIADRRWQATPRVRRDEFASRLRQAGFFTTVRYSMGNDIAAACGQLATVPQGS
jgi:23S rRNA (adenine2503-C2)-methyltransferase